MRECYKSKVLSKPPCLITKIKLGVSVHWDQKRLGHFGFQFSDFQLKSFVDPKPIELWESAIYQKLRLSKLVWLQK